MATFEEHCQKCLEKMGDAFEEVHRWLDEFHGQQPWGTRHRRCRHHLNGIEEVRQKWGDRAALAAEIHIRQDLEREGWPPERPLPRDQEEFRKADLW